MINVSAALKAHYAGANLTVATCWKVTRTDGQVFGFTDTDQDILYSGVTYKAASGFTGTAIQTQAELNVDNMDVEGAFDAANITEADLVAGRWDFAEVIAFELNYKDLTQGVRNLRRAWLGEVRTRRTAFVAEIRGLMQKLQQTQGRTYGANCDADVGDARCGVNLATFTNGTVTGNITAVTSQRVFTASSFGQAAGWFAGGKCTFNAGPNISLAMEVKSFSGGVFTLHLPMPFTVSIGESITVTAGCDKTRDGDCLNKFGNVGRYRGFPDVPGTDRMVSGT